MVLPGHTPCIYICSVHAPRSLHIWPLFAEDVVEPQGGILSVFSTPLCLEVQICINNYFTIEMSVGLKKRNITTGSHDYSGKADNTWPNERVGLWTGIIGDHCQLSLACLLRCLHLLKSNKNTVKAALLGRPFSVGYTSFLWQNPMTFFRIHRADSRCELSKRSFELAAPGLRGTHLLKARHWLIKSLHGCLCNWFLECLCQMLLHAKRKRMYSDKQDFMGIHSSYWFSIARWQHILFLGNCGR